MARRHAVSLLKVSTLLALGSIACQAQALPPVTRHVPARMLTGRAQLLGRLPANQSLRLVLVLPLSNQTALDSLLQNLYDPSSPSYRQFLTVEQFTSTFGPSQDDYNQVISFAEANGFTVVRTSRNRLNIDVTAPVASIERAFNVTMNVYRDTVENRTFYAPDREPAPNLQVQLWHIAGLDNLWNPRPALRQNQNSSSNAITGSGPSNSFLGSDMRAAYYGGTLTGTGQSIGLLEPFGTNLNDLKTYFRNAKQTNTVPITLLSTDGTSTTCLASNGCDDTEQTLDMTQALGMAPGLSSLVVYIGATDVAVFNGMATANPLNFQLSSSWTWSPADPNIDEPYFKEFAAQGQNLFQAAGDTNAWGPNSLIYPADDPYVTSVGGTDLQTSSAGGPWSIETAWVDGGGGVSPNQLPIPSWQTSVAANCSSCSQTYRNGPDVAANANFSFYVCANQTTCTANQLGGTSFAAPMWAGYMALVNEQAVANSGRPRGFINPTLYAIGSSTSYATNFHDITNGSNGDPATIGYDLATGWGSPNRSGLLNSLVVPPNFVLSAAPASQTVVQGSNGNYTVNVTPSGGFSSDVTLSASGLPSGASANFNRNPVTGGGSATLLVNAGIAAPGTYTLTITGSGGAINQTASVALTVIPPPVAVSLTPTAATLYQAQTEQFVATVLHASNTSTTWTLNPSTGTLSSAGLYTAPGIITTQQVVTVTATSVDDATKSASATITLIPSTPWYNSSWTSRKAFTIDHTKVSGSSNLTNFPVLISVTDSSLISVANGGGVGKNDGTDILFTAADGVTKLNHELESYSPTTGHVNAWVQLPSLSPAANTVLYIYYGNASAADQENKPGVWDNTFAGVWHVPNGTTLSVSDATANALITTGSNASAAAGNIGGGVSFAGTGSSYISVASAAPLDSTTGTWSGWFKTSQNLTNAYPLLWARATASGSSSGITLFLEAGTGHARVQVYGSSALSLDIAGATAALNDGNWHYLALTFSAANTAILYLDGSPVASGAPTQAWSFNGEVLRFAAALDSFWTPLNGSEDEFRVSNTVRSPGWIATEYNNQSLPSAFLNFGSTQSAPVAISLTPPATSLYAGQTQQFTATVTNTTNTAVSFSLNPNVGTISAAGLYTAPPTIPTQQTVTLTATSAEDTTKSATAAITLIPPGSWYNTSWANRKMITVGHGSVFGPANLTNFPLLVSVTDPSLRTVAGGGVGKADGSDILFTASDGATKLNHEIELYNGSSGQLIAWVQVPSLSPTRDTVLYMYYGNPLTADQENKPGVWDSTFAGVWHLGNGTALSVADSTANSLTTMNSGAIPAAGEIDGASSFSGSSPSYLSVASSTALDSTTGTWSGWFKTSQSGSAVYPLLWARANTSGSRFGITIFLEAGTGRARVQIYSSSALAVDMTGGAAPLNDGNWHYLTFTFNSSGLATLYVDGSAVASGTPNQSWSFNGQVLRFGASLDTFWAQLNGTEDEFRVSNAVRSSGWVATEYRNQSSPATFLSLGSAEGAPISVTPTATAVNAGLTQQFTATVNFTTNTAVTWSLAPNTGTISASGLYTAPATVNSYQTVVVTATSVADTTKFASAIITLAPIGAWYNASWTNRKPITIDHTRVAGSSNLINFPVLISLTDSSLKSLVDGGNVGKNDGTDILFTAADGITKLNHELETYSPTTGQMIAWVQVPSLSPAANTVLYMYYGNTSAGDQENKQGVWDNTFAGVWHLADGTTLSVSDSTANALITGSSGAAATTGEIDGAAVFSGSNSSFLSVGSSTPLDSTTGSWSGWFKTSQSVSGVYPLLWARANGSGSFSGITLFLEAGSGRARVQMYSSTTLVLDIAGASAALNDGNWHYVALTFNAASVATLYLDGSAIGSGTPNQSWSFNGQALRFAAALDSFWAPLNGSEDEFRVANVVRSPGWVATEYANQSAPSRFYAVSALQGENGPLAATPVFTPGGGSYSSAQSVTISSTTPGASILYTTDGSTPTATNGTPYTGPVTVASSMTLNAAASAVGFSSSAVASVSYSIDTTPWYNIAWTRRKSFSVDHTKVSGASNLTNFPLLVSVTDPSFKTVPNGGGMGKADGTDILFTLADGVTKLNHEIELYNGLTGQLIAWVQIPSLSPATNTGLYIYYGNSSSSDQENKPGVWDSTFAGVWHLASGALSVADSTANALATTNSNANVAAGNIDGGSMFSGSLSSYLSVANSTALDSTIGTWSGWFKTSQSVSGVYPLLWARANASGSLSGITMFLEASTGHARVQVYGASLLDLDIAGGTTALNNGNWHFIALTFNGASAATLYVDGSTIASAAPNQSWSFNGQALRFAAALDSFWTPLNGSEDEFRVATVVRSPGWVATEYSNQNGPSTFVVWPK